MPSSKPCPNKTCLPIFFWAHTSSQLLTGCPSTALQIFVFVLHHIFFHLFTCNKCSQLGEEGAGSAPNDVDSMSPEAMRALLV